MSGIKLITIQTAWAITKAEAKTHLRVDSTDEDVYIENNLIKAAQEACENFTNRKFNDGIYDYYLDQFPTKAYEEGEVLLPYAPIQELTSVKYDDTDNNEQTLTVNTDYYSDIITEPCRVIPIGNWPACYPEKINAVRIRFKTGYTSPDFIPLAAKEAMYLLIGDMFANREDQVRRFPTAVQRLLMPLKVFL